MVDFLVKLVVSYIILVVQRQLMDLVALTLQMALDLDWVGLDATHSHQMDSMLVTVLVDMVQIMQLVEN
jgi:hypothetical protein